MLDLINWVYQGRSPGFRAQVTGMSRKEPVVSLQVFDGILEFSVNRLVRIFMNHSARCLCAREVSLDILNKDSQALRSEAELCGRAKFRLRNFQHDPCISDVDLNTREWIAVLVMHHEPENASQPFCGCRKILICNMGKHRIRRN